MKRFMSMFALALALALAFAPPLPAQSSRSAPRVTTVLPAAELSALRAIRKDVWVHWFSGDTAALRSVLVPELVAVSPDGWQTLDQTLVGAARFKSDGGTFVSVSFDQERTHRFGDVVVLFSNYAVETSRAGKRATQRGRATEVFVRTNGRWVHTSWHLDVTG